MEFTSPGTQTKIKFYHTLTTSTAARKENPPLIFWTNGGPGVSSLSAWFQGISAHTIQEDTTIINNSYNWSQFADIVTTDQPLGSGFSYLTDGEKFRTKFDDITAEYCEFLSQFLTKNGYLEPEKLPKKIVMIGESMSGHFVPQTANCLFKFLESHSKSDLLKVALVSPWIDPVIHYATFKEYAYKTGILPKDEYYSEELEASEKKCLDGLKTKVTEDVVNDCYQFTDDVVGFRYATYDVRIKATHPLSEKKRVLTFKWIPSQKKIAAGGFNDILGINP